MENKNGHHNFWNLPDEAKSAGNDTHTIRQRAILRMQPENEPWIRGPVGKYLSVTLGLVLLVVCVLGLSLKTRTPQKQEITASDKQEVAPPDKKEVPASDIKNRAPWKMPTFDNLGPINSIRIELSLEEAFPWQTTKVRALVEISLSLMNPHAGGIEQVIQSIVHRSYYTNEWDNYLDKWYQERIDQRRLPYGQWID